MLDVRIKIVHVRQCVYNDINVIRHSFDVVVTIRLFFFVILVLNFMISLHIFFYSLCLTVDSLFGLVLFNWICILLLLFFVRSFVGAKNFFLFLLTFAVTIGKAEIQLKIFFFYLPHWLMSALNVHCFYLYRFICSNFLQQSVTV